MLLSFPVISDSLCPCKLQYARPLCPSPSLEVCPSSSPLYWWCHPAISSSDALFSFCSQYFPGSGTLLMNQLFASDDQNIGVSTPASVLPMKGWFLLRLTGLVSLLSKGLSDVFSRPLFESINSSALSLLYGPTLTSVHDYWRNHGFGCTDLCQQSDVFAF